MAAVRLDGRGGPLDISQALPQAAAATSQKKVKETVTQKSWEEQRTGNTVRKDSMISALLFLLL